MTSTHPQPSIRTLAVVYGAVCVATAAAVSQWSSTPVALVCAAVQSLALTLLLATVVGRQRRCEGVERQILEESAAMAFYSTAIAIAIYGIFEQFADAPRVAATPIFLFAFASFLAWRQAIKRRLV